MRASRACRCSSESDITGRYGGSRRDGESFIRSASVPMAASPPQQPSRLRHCVRSGYHSATPLTTRKAYEWVDPQHPGSRRPADRHTRLVRRRVSVPYTGTTRSPTGSDHEPRRLCHWNDAGSRADRSPLRAGLGLLLRRDRLVGSLGPARLDPRHGGRLGRGGTATRMSDEARISAHDGLRARPRIAKIGRGEPTQRCADPPTPALLQGIAEFNRGEFFEQHETLEAAWIDEADPVRYLYQRILQIGVRFHHLSRGN